MYRYDEFDHDFVQARVAEFSDQVQRRLSGEITEDQFRPLRLMNGVYLQLHAYMLRIAVPYGTLNGKQLRMLGHIQLRLVDLVGLKGEQFELLLAQRVAGAEFAQASLGFGQLRVDVAILAAQRVDVRESIQHIELVRRLQQILMIMLSMHIDQHLGGAL